MTGLARRGGAGGAASGANIVIRRTYKPVSASTAAPARGPPAAAAAVAAPRQLFGGGARGPTGAAGPATGARGAAAPSRARTGTNAPPAAPPPPAHPSMAPARARAAPTAAAPPPPPAHADLVAPERPLAACTPSRALVGTVCISASKSDREPLPVLWHASRLEAGVKRAGLRATAANASSASGRDAAFWMRVHYATITQMSVVEPIKGTFDPTVRLYIRTSSPVESSAELGGADSMLLVLAPDDWRSLSEVTALRQALFATAPGLMARFSTTDQAHAAKGARPPWRSVSAMDAGAYAGVNGPHVRARASRPPRPPTTPPTPPAPPTPPTPPAPAPSGSGSGKRGRLRS